MTKPSPIARGTEEEDCRAIGNCPDERIERIYAYLDGALSHQDISDVQQHLAECEDCHAEHDLECIIRSVVKRSCTEKAPDQLKQAIMTRISEVRIQTTH